MRVRCRYGVSDVLRTRMDSVILNSTLIRRASCAGVGWVLIGLLLVAGGRILRAECLPSPRGLVGWWPGDANASNVLGTNRGVLFGNVTTVPGMVDEAFHFDGTNSFISVPDSSALKPTNLTLEAWVRFDDLDSEGNAPEDRQFIVFKQGQLSVSNAAGFDLSKVSVGGANLFTFRATSALGESVVVDSTTPLATNVWYHVAGVRDVDFLRIYVNGQLENQAGVSAPLNYGDLPMYFGSSGQPLWDRKLKGDLDEVTLYDRSLSANEIAAIYEAGTSGKCREVIITSPPRSQEAVAGGDVGFEVVATGFGGLEYRWLFNGGAIAGATNSVLALTNVQPVAAGIYEVVVENILGRATSAPPAILTVNPATVSPPIISNPPASQVGLVGSDVDFAVVASGEFPLSFQWRRNGLPLVGATNDLLALRAVTVGAAGDYDVVVSNLAGSTTSAPPARLTVIPAVDSQPPTILTQPLSQTVGYGASATLAATVRGSPGLSFQWRKDGLSLVDATNAALSFLNVTTNDMGNYDLVAANVAGAATSAVATLSVKLIVDPELEQVLACAIGRLPGQLGIADLAAITNLSVRARGVTNLAGLEFATNLVALDASENRISDLTPLRGLVELTSLALDGNRAELSTLDPLTNLTRLNWLTLGQINVESYAPLAVLTNLVSLDVNHGSVVIPDFLATLTRLKSLSLAQNNLSSLAPLSGLTNLIRLDLRWNRGIADYAPLTVGATNLESLYLEGNSISNLVSLQSLQRLSLLNLADNQLTAVPALEGLPNLNYLVLSRNPVTDFAPLASLTNLAFLELAGNSISNVAFLAPMTRLQYADLAYNHVTNLAPINRLKNLAGLVLTGNPIRNYAVLAKLPSLINLWMQGCSITNADFVRELPGLRHLNLDDNYISNLAPVLTLTNLTGLGVSRNPAVDLVPLTGLTNLTSLRLEGDFLTDVSALTNLVRLSYLSLNQNRLTNAAPLAGLTNLHHHYLRQNRLRDISYLAQVPGLQAADVSLNLLELTHDSGATTLIDDLYCRTAACVCGSRDGLAAERSLTLNYSPQQSPPTITAPARWFLPMNTPATLSFTTAYELLPEDRLTVSGDSSAGDVVSSDSLGFAGSGYSRTVTVAPATNRTGTTTLTLTVMNEAGLSSQARVAVEVLLPVSVTNMFPPAASLDPAFEDALRRASGNGFGELTSADLLNVSRLTAVETDLTGFAGWPWLTNLTSLYLEGETINDLDFLTNLTRLESLVIANTAVTDFSPVGSLTDLTALTLSGGTISNLSFLATCTRLSSLNLSQTRVTDLSPLIVLTNLVSVDAARNSVTNLLALAALPLLTEADVRLNLLDLGADSPTVAAIASLQARNVAVAVLPQRAPPEFQMAAEWFVAAGRTSVLPFELSENGDRLPGPVMLNAISANQLVLADANLKVGSDINSFQWALAITPADNRAGKAEILLTAVNDVGLASTQAIAVTVSTPQALNDQFFGMSDVALRMSGDADWFGQAARPFRGYPAAQSPGLRDGETSALESELIGPGTLRFWWKISSEADYDWLVFESALETNQISGEVDWQEQSIPIAPRTQAVRWYYAKDGAVAEGTDTAWLAHVMFTPATWLDLTGAPTNQLCQFNLYGVPGQTYELQVSTNLVDWGVLRSLECTNRITPFICEIGIGAAQYYRARAVVSSPRLVIAAQFNHGLELSWSGLGVLQSAPTLEGPWETIGGHSPVYVSTTFVPAQYFRVQVTDP